MKVWSYPVLDSNDLVSLVQNSASQLVYNPVITHAAPFLYDAAAVNPMREIIIAVSKYDTADTPSSYNGPSNTGAVVTQQDSNDDIVVTPQRVADAQAGYRVVGVAAASVVRQEFDNYVIIGNSSDAYVLYIGTLKVSKTDVFTPQFLSTINVQFNG